MCFRHAHYFLITLSFETVCFAQVNQIPSFFFFLRVWILQKMGRLSLSVFGSWTCGVRTGIKVTQSSCRLKILGKRN